MSNFSGWTIVKNFSSLTAMARRATDNTHVELAAMFGIDKVADPAFPELDEKDIARVVQTLEEEKQAVVDAEAAKETAAQKGRPATPPGRGARSLLG
mmetsp:Transcript_28204/g.80990  ORF Transcript_28204/g.80990 Transcript_28204/m.80990 type:complete len:97 (-) Transcript_28204:76-366(-)